MHVHQSKVWAHLFILNYPYNNRQDFIVEAVKDSQKLVLASEWLKQATHRHAGLRRSLLRELHAASDIDAIGNKIPTAPF